MPAFSFQSASLTPQMAPACSLRMVVGQHIVSLLVKNEQKILALKSWNLSGSEQKIQSRESELRNVFGSEPMLAWSFESRSCALSFPAATLVPRRLFDRNNLEQYFKLLLRQKDERVYGYELLDAFDCYLVWAAEAALERLCEQYFSPEQTQHLGTPLLKAYQGLAPTEGYAVFAHLQGQSLEIAVFERRNLVYFNTFDFSKPSDLLYYVLLAYKLFDLNPLEIPLTLSGTLIEDSDAFRLLFRYIRPMRFPPLPESLQIPAEAKELPDHFWFDLAVM